MEHPLAIAQLVASVPILLALVRWLGPRRASAVGVLGVFLLLPRYGVVEDPDIVFTFDKVAAAGASLAAGVLLFDRRALARFRPHWVDVPMLAYVASPLLSVAAGSSENPRRSVDESWLILAEWGVPYLLGRIYFADRGAIRWLAIAVVVAGLLTIPACLYEMTLGPDWFLRPAVFGIRIYKPMASRLGGWRPEACFSSGVELSVWMGLTAVLAAWLWASRDGWRPRRVPAWLPSLSLAATTVACRGAFGYLTMAVGLAAIAAVFLSRTRLILAGLLVVAPAYIGLRATNAWDGRALVRLAGAVDARSASSISPRIQQEDQYVAAVARGHLAFGLGKHHVDYADGWWIYLLRTSGLFGVAAHFAAFMIPAALVIFRRTDRPPWASIEVGLAIFVILHALDGLMNRSMIAPTTLIGGALAGLYLAETGRGGPARVASRPSVAGSGGHATYRLDPVAGRGPVGRSEWSGPVGSVLALACLLYVFGHAPAEGRDGLKFVGGLGSALLFAASGAAAASLRQSPARVASFGLAFALLGISFPLALHPTDRPVGSADILQGLALSGVLVMLWRPGPGSESGAFAALAAAGTSWWAFGGAWRAFPGSQYLFDSGDPARSPFPVLPWLSMAALGAILVRVSAARAWTLAAGFAVAAAMARGRGWPLGPPTKFPMNATYGLAGAALASSAFAASGPIRHWSWSRAASDWLGRRWLIFFYIHLGVAVGLGRLGLTRPLVCWALTGSISLGLTWAVAACADRARWATRRPSTWAVLGSAILAVGLLPGVPPFLVRAIAGASGLLFAAGAGDLAAMVLGPATEGPGPAADDRVRGLFRLALLAAALAAPEVVGLLPPPIGTGAPVGGGTAPAGKSPGPNLGATR
jgi:hypothetical protein